MGCLQLRHEDYREERPSLSVAWKNPLLKEEYLISQKHYKKCALKQDHLGNGRVWVKYNELTEQPEVIQQADYYPFGLQHDGKQNVQSGVVNNYRFNHIMERTENMNLNWDLTMFRPYDGALGRFTGLDPLAELTFQIDVSPYAFGYNNPISVIDPFGLFGSRKEARQYKRANNIRGRIKMDNDGVFAVNDKRNGTSYFRDPSTEGLDNVLGMQEDGVIAAPLTVAKDKSDARTFYGNLEHHWTGGADNIAAGAYGLSSLSNPQINKFGYETSKKINSLTGAKNIPGAGIKAGQLNRSIKTAIGSTTKVAGKLGAAGNVLTTGLIIRDFTNGSWDASTIVDGVMVSAGVAAVIFGAPVVGAGVVLYGVGDYAFGFSDRIDKNLGKNSKLMQSIITNVKQQ